ncbi:hypothetical protein BJ742DRAFT_285009 [Cladochytrium replicatum]|nr:hypothetical protein BJ742DRAFT_285009 [Cladochytrium replicatum]
MSLPNLPNGCVDIVMATHNGVSVDPQMISFKRNDIIFIHKKDASGWWHGTCGSKTGWIPSNYVRSIKNEPARYLGMLNDHTPGTFHSSSPSQQETTRPSPSSRSGVVNNLSPGSHSTRFDEISRTERVEEYIRSFRDEAYEPEPTESHTLSDVSPSPPPSPETVKLWCMLDIGTEVFDVDVSVGKHVSAIKDRIKELNANDLQNVDARHLRLVKVSDDDGFPVSKVALLLGRQRIVNEINRFEGLDMEDGTFEPIHDGYCQGLVMAPGARVGHYSFHDPESVLGSDGPFVQFIHVLAVLPNRAGSRDPPPSYDFIQQIQS